ncbi:MAG: sigma-70 family RNA polymerase sigma factor [Planctomycetota bacterium]|nr:sigma-70 family RNA polymerase sigma factor [Planctomycetota bacterium]
MHASFDVHWRKQALAGNSEAVQKLTDVALQALYCFCLYRVGNRRELCEEVVQETVLRALDQLEDYDPQRAENDILLWLTGLARNQIRRTLAREKGIVSLEEMWARVDSELLAAYARLDGEVFSDDVLRREETRQLVNATMSQLPPHYREALEHKYIQGKNVREMAQLQGVSEKAAESLLTRAREAFRAAFLAISRNLETNAGSAC